MSASEGTSFSLGTRDRISRSSVANDSWIPTLRMKWMCCGKHVGCWGENCYR